jgi:hypothetical protein
MALAVRLLLKRPQTTHSETNDLASNVAATPTVLAQIGPKHLWRQRCNRLRGAGVGLLRSLGTNLEQQLIEAL